MPWEKLQILAAEEVKATLEDLPGALAAKARAVPVTFEHRPNRAQRRDGIEPDTLGLFVGAEYADEESATVPIPPQIILFLDNLWEWAGEDEEIFCEEVSTTYLHELGHYLGLDEDGLFERGLD